MFSRVKKSETVTEVHWSMAAQIELILARRVKTKKSQKCRKLLTSLKKLADYQLKFRESLTRVIENSVVLNAIQSLW